MTRLLCGAVALVLLACQQDAASGQDPDGDAQGDALVRPLADTGGGGGMGGEGGSASCEPTDELCNGADDDCDDKVDEGFGLGAPCVEGLGLCQVEGTMVCGDDGEATCSESALPW